MATVPISRSELLTSLIFGFMKYVVDRWSGVSPLRRMLSSIIRTPFTEASVMVTGVPASFVN